MIVRIYSTFLVSLLLLLPCMKSYAAESSGLDVRPGWIDPGWRRTLARHTITFDEAGLSNEVFEFEIKALDEKGAEAIAQQSFQYNSYFDELSSTELATLKADGSVVAVDERAIRDQPASTDSSSPYFDEVRNRIIAFPHVAPGDSIRGRLVYKAKQARFPGEFARVWSEPASQPPELLEVIVDGPASRPLRIAMRNVEHWEERGNDRIIHRVRFRQDTPRSGQIDDETLSYAARFEASTFADYAAFAATLNARNAPMARPDEKIARLSREIIGEATGSRVKIERIYNWVARNIRYVGIGLEDGGWTSQPASAVLASRYGDCKAHATLFKALLAAQGIEVNLVAVNSQARYTLTEIATPNFDHAIAYVPEIDQYLDPTASLFAFGSLPSELAGKPVLNIDKGTLGRIPMADPTRFRLAAETDYVLGKDGKRDVRSILSGTGIGAQLGRALALGLDDSDRRVTARKLIEQAGLTGTGDYTYPNPRELTDDYAITSTFQISKIIALDRPAHVRMLPLTDPRRSFLRLIARQTDGRPFVCRPMEYREVASLTVPENTFFYEKPAPVTYSAAFEGRTGYGMVHGRIDVSSTIVLDGRTIRSSAVLRLALDAPVCPPEFGAAIEKGFDKLDDFRYGPIGLTPKGASSVVEVSADYTEGANAYLAHDFERAMERLKPLAEIGNARAQAHVGAMYRDGSGTKRDAGEAVKWFRLAAEQGDPYSQEQLAYLQEAGPGQVRDEKQAADWYAKAAEQGRAYSQMRLAAMYRDGRGVPQDLAVAFDLFSRAAEQGSTYAQMSLGLMHIKGQGVPQDLAKGISLLRMAADQNDSWAQYNLGWAYESGTGVPKDTQQAIKWYTKASDRGNEQAGAHLYELTRGGGSFWGSVFSRLGLARW
ncbi:TPR repeat protein [Bradyrhizobium sp. R2.2-H]|jgi:TPR repeat protein|nr:TPR repeat protein [Bradyrhizobium sp. Y-H1]TCU77753.1 TPR repeat protein [Bradyrhizobium sp. R2.2-H]